MTDNPLQAIEVAEQEANALLQQATQTARELVDTARDAAVSNKHTAIQQAEEQAKAVLQQAEAQSKTSKDTALATLENKVEELRVQAITKQPQAIAEIIKQLSVLL